MAARWRKNRKRRLRKAAKLRAKDLKLAESLMRLQKAGAVRG